jgi:hypothetical protein
MVHLFKDNNGFKTKDLLRVQAHPHTILYQTISHQKAQAEKDHNLLIEAVIERICIRLKVQENIFMQFLVQVIIVPFIIVHQNINELI